MTEFCVTCRLPFILNDALRKISAGSLLRSNRPMQGKSYVGVVDYLTNVYYNFCNLEFS